MGSARNKTRCMVSIAVFCYSHRRSQGVQWVQMHHSQGEKKIGIVYMGKFKL